MKFIKIKNKDSIIDLDDVKIITTSYDVNVHVLTFHFKQSGYFKWSFHSKNEIDEVLKKINLMLNVEEI